MKKIITCFAIIFLALVSLALGLAACSNETSTVPSAVYSVVYEIDSRAEMLNATQTYRAGETFILPSPAVVGEDEQFLAWDDGTNEYNAGEEYVMPADDVVFVAKWLHQSPLEGEWRNCIGVDVFGEGVDLTATVIKNEDDGIVLTLTFIFPLQEDPISESFGLVKSEEGDYVCDLICLSYERNHLFVAIDNAENTFTFEFQTRKACGPSVPQYNAG